MVQDVSKTHSLTVRNVFHFVWPQYATHKTLLSILVLLNAAVILSTFVCMMPGAGGNASRQPPAWGPEMEMRGESSYTFRKWSRDLLLWTTANNDLDPHRQAAVILSQLRGANQRNSNQRHYE